MIAQVCNLDVGEFVHNIGDAHLYSNHVKQAKLQVKRHPKPLCRLELNKDIKCVFDFKAHDIHIVNYEAHPHIKGDVSV